MSLKLVGILAAAIGGVAASAHAEGAAPAPSPAALLFGKKCSSCHTLGDGDKTGPDLLGVTKRREVKWIRSFISNPSAAIDGGDAIANELLAKFKNVRMPEQVLTPEELDGLLAYFDACTAKGGCKPELGKVRHAREAKPKDRTLGRALFEGRQPLANGGPACLSCHHVRGAGLLGGGRLAKDLTFAYARLGDAGMSAALADAPFPLMKEIFPKHPLRPDEQFALKAYFAATAKGAPPTPNHNFFYVGVLGLFLSLGAIGLIWRNRGTSPADRGDA